MKNLTSILNNKKLSDDDKICILTQRGILDNRTLRLFGCECVSRLASILPDKRQHDAIEVAVKYANGEATEEDRRAAITELYHSRDTIHYNIFNALLGILTDTPHCSAIEGSVYTALAVRNITYYVDRTKYETAYENERKEQFKILKSLLSN